MTEKINIYDKLSIILLVFLVIYIVTVSNYFGSSNTEFTKVVENITPLIGEDMIVADNNYISETFGIDSEQCEIQVWYTEDYMDVKEVLIAKSENKDVITDISEKLSIYVDEEIKKFDGYGEEQVNLLKNSIIKTNGNYLFFCVSDDTSALVKAYSDAL